LPQHALLYVSLHHPYLHSFPTRRSSDLKTVPKPIPNCCNSGSNIVKKLHYEITNCSPSTNYSITECIPNGAKAAPKPIPNRCYRDRKSTRLNSSHVEIWYHVSCLKKKR